MALSLLMQGSDQNLKCAALCYGFMLDCGPSTAVADASRTFGFVNPCAGKSVKDLRAETPLFVARAGRDEVVGLNDTIDLFAAEALECNLPLSLANHPAAPHAFDLMYDHNDSRESIRHLLTFLRFHLLME
jgi:dienelactone hydrolase